MKRIHYINFGLPKTGTTWLFDKLVKHPEVDYCGIKENKYLENIGYPLVPYMEYYNQYNVSLSFSPGQWSIETKQLRDLNIFSTHYSISLRNPYEFANSLINFVPPESYKHVFVQDLINLRKVDYVGIIKRLRDNLQKPLLILYYDDLVKDPKSYVKTVLDHLGLEHDQDFYDNFDSSPINVTNYTEQLSFSNQEISTINQHIDRLSDYLEKDFSSWKKQTL